MTVDRRETDAGELQSLAHDDELAGLWERWCAGEEPVHDRLLARGSELPPEHLVQLLIVDQQRRWHQGDRVRVEALLEQYPCLESNRDCALDLVYAEFLLELDIGGSPSVDRYLDRFPQFREGLQRQFDLERGMSEHRRHGFPETTKFDAATGIAVGEGDDEQVEEKRHPRRFGDYELLEVIATGGMGIVYKARQRKLNRVVALKMIRSGEFAEPEHVERFYTEAKAAANLQHPHIVAIHEVGEQAGQHFYSMDFVEGQTLAEMVREHALPPQRAAAYVKTIAQAMQYAHDHGVLHRDLKPANVLINEADEPQIADFGLAKQLDDQSQLTIEGLVIGTPSYMPPEQASGRIQDVGPASDVYSIGAILYELLTGRPPFQGANRFETIQQVLDVEPVSPRLLSPSVPRDLETICLKCLQKDPARRYPTAGELADDVGRFLADQPITARPVGRAERLWRWCHRNPYLAAAISVAAICLLGAVVSLVWGYVSTKSALATAERRLDQTRTAIDELFTLVAEETLLNKPGLQPLRKQLLRKARDLYREVLAAEGDDPRIRHDLSVSHFRYGRIMEELGSPEEALEPLHRARRMQERLLSDQPQNAELQCDLSNTWNSLGTVLSSLRKYSEARPYFQRAHDARRALVERDPDNREYQRKLANVLMHLGVIDNEVGDLSAARSQMEAAQEVRERLLKGEPNSEMIRRDLAKGYFNLARVAIALRDHAAKDQDAEAFEENHRRALDFFERSIDQFKKLPPDSPWALSDQYLLATCYHLQGRETWEPEQAAEAERLYDEARSRMQSLADANPEVHHYQGDLAGIYLEIGGLYSGQDEDKSLTMYEEARKILARLVERFPAVPDYRTNLATALREIGVHHLKRDQPDEAARVIYQSAEHVLQLEASLPDGSVYEQDLVQVVEVLALTYFDRGEAQKAIECVDWGLRLDPDNERFRELRQRRADSEEDGESTGPRATGRSP